MSGLKSRNGKRFSSKVTQDFGPVRARMRRLKYVLVACPLVWLGIGGSVGNQDIFSLVNSRKAESPRWMMYLEPANFTTKVAPKLALGTTPVPDHISAPILTLTSADEDFEARPLVGFEEVAMNARPTEVPDTILTNSTAKSDRLITMAPDRQMVDRAAGNLYAMSSLISTEKKHEDLRASPSSRRSRSTLRKPACSPATQGWFPEGGPLDLQKVMMLAMPLPPASPSFRLRS